MSAELPGEEQVMQAIKVYLHAAYNDDLPLRVRSQLKVLDAWHGDFYSCSIFVHDQNGPVERYYIRFGNQHYPHMKLAIERLPTGERYVYRVDTHDRHCCPAPDQKEYAEFVQLMENNQKLAEKIEAAWDVAGLPTFKAYLREDLKRRQQAMMHH